MGFIIVIPIIIFETIELLPWLTVFVSSISITKGTADYKDFDIGTIIGFIFYMSFIVAALTEETAKFLCCFLLKSHQPTITKPYTIVILITCSALGFAILENYGYVLTAAFNGKINTLLIEIATRDLVSVPLHTVTGILIGCKMAQQYIKGDPITFKFYLQSLWLPVLLHGFFDVFAFLGLGGGYYQIAYAGNALIILLGIYLCYKNISLVKSVDQLLPV